MTELSQDQLALQQRARELAQTVFKPTAAATDQSEQYPWDNVRLLRESGFMGMTINLPIYQYLLIFRVAICWHTAP